MQRELSASCGFDFRFHFIRRTKQLEFTNEQSNKPYRCLTQHSTTRLLSICPNVLQCSSVYSLTNLGKCGTSETYFLPCVLTYGYLVCLVALLFLVPVVWRFQLLRTDLVSVKGFPDSFYHVSVVKEVIQRYRCAQVRIEVTRLLESNVGHWNALEIKRYLDEGNRELAYV